MAFLIDTNIAIHARDGNGQVLDALARHDGAILLSALSLAELQRGIYKNPVYSSLRAKRLAILLRAIPVVPFDAAAANLYGGIIAKLGWVKGRDFDRMIAAHALSLRATLVTDNQADFADIGELAMENWLR